MVIVFLLFIPLGLLMFFKPTFIWALTESWKSADATEPSSLYLFSTRIGGTIFTILGIIGVIIFAIM
ncbi:DUF6199 family natural product biosynthesis protein [Fredinandcohnia sp. 179-A 10B2 NHS]|uniref:DUF6199 family natural product biosynthesis protein n=1 Tax=Fredinandcohnia sp. 179-A 10B2 NHS TaxID=3235176 RepID=UPI0039A08FE7